MKPMRVVVMLMLLVAIVCAVVFARGYSIANTRLARQAPDFVAQVDSSQFTRGEHLAAVVCAGCHSADATLPLAGGTTNLLATHGGPGLGTIVAPNLTPAGV